MSDRDRLEDKINGNEEIKGLEVTVLIIYVDIKNDPRISEGSGFLLSFLNLGERESAYSLLFSLLCLLPHHDPPHLATVTLSFLKPHQREAVTYNRHLITIHG